MLDRFAQIRRVFSVIGGDSPALRVFVFRSAKEFRAFADAANTAGFYQQGLDRDYIVLYGASGFTRTAAHEYIHLILDRGDPLPRWFEEGTAEVYSNLDFQGRQMVVGAPVPQYLALLASAPWLDAAQLRNARNWQTADSKLSSMFYAESWALAHMLNLAPGWRDRMPAFAETLSRGRDDPLAFREAFGKTMEQAVAELPGYLPNLRGVTLDAPPPSAPAPVEVSAVAPLEAAMARAELALAVDHAAQARGYFLDAAQAAPRTPGAEAALGLLALAENRREQARSRLERAIEMGSRDAAIYFQLAMLERDAGQRPRSNQLLRRAIALNPNLGEAQFLLGSEAMDRQDWETAVGYLQAAARALPRKSYIWTALALTQTRLGLEMDARISAARAYHTAQNEQEQQAAEALR